MIHAYDKVYLDKAHAALGRMLDFAVYDLKYDITDFFRLFIESGTACQFESGDFSVITGMSGVELAYHVLEKSGVRFQRVIPNYTPDRSKEYWTGWALAHYQWETSLTFAEIVQYIPIKDIMALYSPYHEMDIRQFTDRMNTLYRTAKPESNLKLLRQSAGLSQRELSELSGIPLRTIQQYEQRQKISTKHRANILLCFQGCCAVRWKLCLRKRSNQIING